MCVVVVAVVNVSMMSVMSVMALSAEFVRSSVMWFSEMSVMSSVRSVMALSVEFVRDLFSYPVDSFHVFYFVSHVVG